jgi:predicted PurR-regulated permease PerM
MEAPRPSPVSADPPTPDPPAVGQAPRPRPGPWQQDLTRTTLGVLLIFALIAAAFWILRPFLPAAIWATMIVVATWPLMKRVQANLWNKRFLAVIVMTILLLLVFVLPFSLAVRTIIHNSDRLVVWAESLNSFVMPAAPAWLVNLPLVGTPASRFWTQLQAMDLAELRGEVAPYAGTLARWFIAEAGGLGIMLLQFLLTVIFAAIMYSAGEDAAAQALQFGRRLAGERGETAVHLAGQAIRGVAMGVVITAVIQAALGGLGLAICGVPFATILTAIMFMLCIAQLGPSPVLVPAVIWMFWNGDTTWASVLLVWSLVVISLDNFIRPILIKRSADLPLLLIFIGVIGGLMAFGLIGIFVGPVVLAVGFTLLQAWIADRRVAAR